jgi:hypothetical protein
MEWHLSAATIFLDRSALSEFDEVNVSRKEAQKTQDVCFRPLGAARDRLRHH